MIYEPDAQTEIYPLPARHISHGLRDEMGSCRPIGLDRAVWKSNQSINPEGFGKY